MLRLFAGGILLFALLVAAEVPKTVKEPSLAEGARLRNAGLLDEAETVLGNLWLKTKDEGPPDAALAYGRVCVMEEKWVEAKAPLTKAAARKSPLRPYAEYQLALALAGGGKPGEAEKVIEKLLADSLSRDMRRKVLLLGASTARSLEKRRLEAARLRSYIATRPSRGRREEAFWKLASALEASGRPREAFRIYRNLYLNGAFYGHASKAAMQHLASKKGYALPSASTSAVLARVSSWIKKGRQAEAWEVLEQLKGRRLSKGAAEKYAFLRVACLYALRRNSDAVREAGAMEKRFSGKLVTKALLKAAWCCVREGDHAGVLRICKRLLAVRGKGKTADSALFVMGLSAYTTGRFDEAIALFDRLLAVTPAGAARVQPVETMRAWCIYERKEYGKAAGAFGSAAAAGTDETDLTGACTYWRARCLLRTGGVVEGNELLRRLAASPAGYWADRAGAWLDAAGVKHLSQPSTLEVKEWPTAMHSRKTSLARRLALCGLEGDAAALLYPYYRSHRDDPAVALTMAELYARSGKRWNAERTLKRVFGDVMKLRLPPESLVRMLYTTPYRAKIISVSALKKVPPALTFAVVRSESGFDRTAFSPSGARGLLQLMPETARKLSAELKVKIPAPESLYEPDLNLLLGVHHLSQLTRRFPRAGALAAYNAGEKVTSRWLKSFEPGSEEQFTAMIPYRETRRYCERILLDEKRYARVIEGQEEAKRKVLEVGGGRPEAGGGGTERALVAKSPAVKPRNSYPVEPPASLSR